MTLSPRSLFGRYVLFLLRMAGWLTRRLGMPGTHRRMVRHLLRRTGLFDGDWYLLQYPDVAAAGMDPLEHFIRYGDVEGRSPRRLFDPPHYRGHVQPKCPADVNSLLHYAWLGRHVGASTSPWFDAGHYLLSYRDVKFSHFDPLLHFLWHGWQEGREPIANFDRPAFLRAHPDHDPAATAEMLRRAGMPHAMAPSAAEWNALAPSEVSGAVVDIIVPVYRGRDETLRCLHSVLAARQETPFELIVVNDASPEQGLVTALQELAAHGLFTLIDNESNLGLAGSVNRAMRLHADRDVVLLNADTLPYNDWIDRLHRAARRDDRVATVTPLSNNANICSYPAANRDNPGQLEIDGATLDALAAAVNTSEVIEAPTGVGFCLYIRRSALDAVGLLDEKVFGGGYGAEEDFCERARAAGLRNLVATDTYVWHWGATSFGGLRHARLHVARQALAARHPRHAADLADFIRRDPLAGARRRLDEARLRRADRGDNVLLLTHSRGGGTGKLVRDDVEALRANGHGVYKLRSKSPSLPAQFLAADVVSVPNLPGIDSTDTAALLTLLTDWDIREVRVHQLVDFPERTAAALREALAAAARPVRLTLVVHDYYPVCPRINLVDNNGVYCGEPRDADCNRCLQRLPRPPVPATADIARWRQAMRALHESAQQVIVPDEDVALRLRRYFPGARIAVVPHEAPAARPLPSIRQARAEKDDGIIHVVTIGAITRIKGYDVLAACARDARARGLPLRFTVMGFTRNDAKLRSLGVRITGRYEEAGAVDRLQSLAPSITWLPSVCPETYSYTLSIAMSAASPVAAFDLGAIAGRLRSSGHPALLMPPEWMRSAQRINDRFMAWATTGAEADGVDAFTSAGQVHER